MICDMCGGVMESVPISKYSNTRTYGTNHFCKNPDCDFEVDTNT